MYTCRCGLDHQCINVRRAAFHNHRVWVRLGFVLLLQILLLFSSGGGARGAHVSHPCLRCAALAPRS